MPTILALRHASGSRGNPIGANAETPTGSASRSDALTEKLRHGRSILRHQSACLFTGQNHVRGTVVSDSTFQKNLVALTYPGILRGKWNFVRFTWPQKMATTGNPAENYRFRHVVMADHWLQGPS